MSRYDDENAKQAAELEQAYAEAARCAAGRMSDPVAPWGAIRARSDAATPGPWGLYVDANGKTVANTVVSPDHGAHGGVSFVRIAITLNSGDSVEREGANAAFIAAARTDITLLLAEVDRLSGEAVRIETLRAEDFKTLDLLEMDLAHSEATVEDHSR